MQGDEMKAIRKSLGVTQAQFGAALDVTAVFIGMMERDERQIERRTELAVRYLAMVGIQSN